MKVEESKGALCDPPDLQSTFERDRHAMTRGDMDQLSSVWAMNPAKRREMDRLASAPERVSISRSQATCEIDGDRATLRFVQRRAGRKLSGRGMAAYDAGAGWDGVTTR